jgi:hypothetical protein
MLPEVLEVLHELVDVVATLRGINGNRGAELHAKLDQAAAGVQSGPSSDPQSNAGLNVAVTRPDIKVPDVAAGA